MNPTTETTEKSINGDVETSTTATVNHAENQGYSSMEVAEDLLVEDFLSDIDAGDDDASQPVLQLLEFKLECIATGVGNIQTAVEAREELKELTSVNEKFDALLADPTVFSRIPFQRKLQFASKFRDLRGKLCNVIEARGKRSREEDNDDEVSSRCFKLPAIDIPKFAGSIEKWASFKGLFLNLLNDQRIRGNDQAKTHFLFQALSGEALALVENLRDANFSDCWSLLTTFYDDPFRRIKAHHDALFRNLEPNLSLRQLLVVFTQHTSGLRAAYKDAKLDPFEQVIIATFLDQTSSAVRLAWEQALTEKRFARSSLENFFTFVKQKSVANERASRPSERASRPKPSFSRANSHAQDKKGKSSAHSFLATHTDNVETDKPRFCKMCSERTHFLSQCPDFRKLTVPERIEFVKTKTICAVCFRNLERCKGGPTRCPLKQLFCAICKKSHNTLLHLKAAGKNIELNSIREIDVSTKLTQVSLTRNCENLDARNVEISGNDSPSCVFNQVVANCRAVASKDKEALLATAIIKIKVHNQNKFVEARALLDSGSQLDFISSSLIKKLNSVVCNTTYSVSGIGQSFTAVNKCTKIDIVSCHSNFQLHALCLIVDNIVESMIPNQYFEIDTWNIPSNITLADPYFNIPAGIDLLLGLDVFWSVLGTQKFYLEKGLPHFRESKLGWIIAGSINVTDCAKNTFVFFSNQSKGNLLKAIERFWIIDSCEGQETPLTLRELECENLFEQTTFQREDGRFVVSLPFKQDPEVLGDSRTQALRRFHYLEKRFSCKIDFKEQYSACIAEYLRLGHMRKIRESGNDSHATYYIPHHAVVKPDSTTTKLRVVFDASMKTSNGQSLNDILLTGPVVQQELLSILLRFRMHKYVFVADITKMYRQIRIHPTNASLQRIFWRDSPDKEIECFELDTLTFGTRPAPYLATRCLKELALKWGHKFPAARSVLLNDFYVDDVLTGSNSIRSVLVIQEQLKSVLASAGFELSKWCANNSQLLAAVDENHRESEFPLSFGDKQTIKTLGMLWLPTDDTFKIWFHSNNASNSKTKRQVLSVIASIFDPMGLVGPVVVTAKLFMQILWQTSSSDVSQPQEGVETQKSNKKRATSLAWDEPLPAQFLQDWRKFTANLHLLNDMEVPRYIFTERVHTRFELHGFADASTKAYGAVIYCRIMDSSKKVRVSLLCSKSRVAPLKQLSISRLELCAALLLSELCHKTRAILAIHTNIDLIRLWSDSKVALSWIGSQSTKWNVFVAHRVSKIQTLTQECLWDYVESALNPADTLSRGAFPQDLAANSVWWKGPVWLNETQNPWTTDIRYFPNKEEEIERKSSSKIYSLPAIAFKSDWFSFMSEPNTGRDSMENLINRGFLKFVRLTALLLRFRNNCQVYFPKTHGTLKFFELQGARTVLIKLAQGEHFSREIESLKKHGKLDATDSKLLSLAPFIDSDGILRVGGRLENALMSFEQKHPILLHHKHKFTKVIVLHEHINNLHAGPRLLKSILRRKYWILRLEDVVRTSILKCHTCIRYRATTHAEMMANLPEPRTVPNKAFSHTGVDYSGAYDIIQRGGRRPMYVKAYVVIFVCFVTKAIHLELVSDLTTQSFLATLNRFVSRRGVPSHLHSDQGTTFRGADAELKRLYAFLNENNDFISKFALSKGIQWHFIPPRSPHFGGLWEAGVKSVKAHLKRVLCNKKFNFEEFSTVLTQIEACLNSRPLTPESSDPNDFNALTPGHFLIGGPLTSLPCQSFVDVPDNRVKLWEKVQKTTQLFWKRWSLEYLNTLQQRHKWRLIKDELKLGDLVLIKEDNTTPTSWRTGRIVQLHPGADGLNRVVTLKTATGLIKRPCVKLIYLPTSGE